jgi:predicted lipid-binding transport protein (Tim44 family)
MAVDAARARTVAPDLSTQPHARPRPRPRARPAQRGRLASGVVWIGLLAVLLGGIVALNVAVLQLNLQLDSLGQERGRLRTENAQLRQQAALNAVPGTIRDSATSEGYRPANWARTRYVDLEPNTR